MDNNTTKARPNADMRTAAIISDYSNNVIVEVHRVSYYSAATVTFNGYPIMFIDVENSDSGCILWDWLEATNPGARPIIQDCQLLLLVELNEIDYDEDYQPWLVDMDDAAFDLASSAARSEGHGVLNFVEKAYRAVAL